MNRALVEARKGIGRTSPNPTVGAVIARDGVIIATGWHRRAGTAHAEIVALEAAGEDARGATLYSTLEPCVHHGRTGPCTEAILGAGIARVVVGAIDPNPRVKRRGIARLRSQGVEVVHGVRANECEALNEPFNHAIVTGRPFIVAKAAASLDGRIATRLGESKWITSEAARRRGRALRGELDAILVGIGTVLADDPLLTARQRGAHDPVRVILDSNLRTPPKAQVVATARKTRTMIFTTPTADVARRRRLERQGVEVHTVSSDGGRVDLRVVLAALYAEGLNGVLVEGGAEVLGSFFDAELVDKLVLFLAPFVIGGADSPAFAGGHGIAALGNARRFERTSVEVVAGDVMITAHTKRARRP
ncbi:MAG: bifunctional diaminohydroxyphosphoribosylaminopyrimidine deaminase/5-amino-6-(5-phosphoribosylamino)uracil reductase RibD [Deltaproteobacteria bacterium]|nr:bifunctional diaminohydroxyphosphoribosylaminopyrimidine deaminase/5-amino-6-(5-phosphoribosylamino)uracil reductase RibD [Deltaproteobacteria bacterium]